MMCDIASKNYALAIMFLVCGMAGAWYCLESSKQAREGSDGAYGYGILAPVCAVVFMIAAMIVMKF